MHGQYGVVRQVLTARQPEGGKPVHRVQVGPHANGDNTTWADLFARAVFRVNDAVAVRRAASQLRVLLRATITGVEGSPAALPLILTLEGGAGDGAETIALGDIVEPLSAVPASVRAARHGAHTPPSSQELAVPDSAESILTFCSSACLWCRWWSRAVASATAVRVE